LANETDRLGNLLGDDHDLAVFGDILAKDSLRLGDKDAELLSAFIERRRGELERDSMSLGCRFFAERPKDLMRRLEEYWKVWRRENTSGNEVLHKAATPVFCDGA